MKKPYSTKRKFGVASGWLLVAACMAAIFYLSAQPSVQSAELSQEVMSGFFAIFTKLSGLIGHDAFRTLAHFTEYTGLGALLFHSFLQTSGYARPTISFLIAALYAVTDEIHQLFVPGRAFQLSDIAVDCAGAALGVAVCCLIFILVKRLIDKKAHGSH